MSLLDSSVDDVALLEKLKTKRFIKKERVDGDIFMGEYFGLQVRIEQVRNSKGIAKRIETLIASNQHENVARFFGADCDEEGNVDLAFENYDVNLYNYLLRATLARPGKVKDIIRGLCHGVLHLHTQAICHGNLNPWTVFVSDLSGEQVAAKIHEVGKHHESWSDTGRDQDIESVGKMIVFCFTGAYRTIKTMEEYKKSRATELLALARGHSNKEAFDVASILITHKVKPPLLSVLNHPWFWDAGRRLQFLRDVSDLLQLTAVLNAYSAGYLRPKVNDLIEFNWKKHFPPLLIDYRNAEESKQGTDKESKKGTHKELKKGIQMLRFIRNLTSHRMESYYNVESDESKAICTSDESLELHIRTKFPGFMLDVLRILKANRLAKKQLPRYFH